VDLGWRFSRTHRAPVAVAMGLLAAAFVGGCGGETSPAAPTRTEAADGDGVLGEWVASGGLRRTYGLHVPEGCRAGACPLIVAFHGAGGSHRFPENVGLYRAADRGTRPMSPAAEERAHGDVRRFPPAHHFGGGHSSRRL